MLTLLAAAPVAADYELGLVAYDAGDYETAHREWLPVAEAGHADAQYRLGRLYYYGRGVEADPQEAARWYRLAAEQGHARSQSNLGFMYQSGRGLPQDHAQAALWFSKAAEQGRALAQYELGRCYEIGRGLARDDSLAARWYERAAKQGVAEAIYDLARLLESGRGIPQDRKRAEKLYRRAAKKGIDRDRRAQHPEVVDGDDDEPAAIAAAPVIETKTRAAVPESASPVTRSTPTDPEGQYRLGERHRLGDGTEADLLTAARWYEAAAEQGHGLAMYRLAFLYYRGRGAVDRPDFVRAYVWFRRAAAAGVGDSDAWVARVEKKLSPRELSEAEGLLSGGSAKDSRP